MKRLAPALLLVLVVILPGCRSDDAIPHETPAAIARPVLEEDLGTIRLSADAEARLGIEVDSVAVREVRYSRVLAGEVMARPGGQITMTAPLSGTVQVRNNAAFSPGARAVAGTTVLSIEALPAEGDVLRLRADLAVAEGELSIARARSDRSIRLAQDSLISQEQYETIRQQLIVAEAAWEAARARMASVTGAPAGDSASGSVAIVIQAPFSGMIQQVMVAPGQLVAAGAPLFVLVATDALWVRVPVYAGDAASTRSDAPAILVESAGKDTLALTPVAGPPTADPTSITVDRYYQLPPGTRVRPGQRVSLAVPLGSADSALVVPWSAVVHDAQGGAWVYRRLAPLTYQRHRVDVARVEQDMAVLARGPRAGDQVVVVGAAELFSTEFGPAGH